MSKFLDFKDSKEWVKTSKELSQIREFREMIILLLNVQ